jgi:hypothetical protein
MYSRTMAVSAGTYGVTMAMRRAPIRVSVRTSAPALLTTAAGWPFSSAAVTMTFSDSTCAPGPCAITATRQA